MTGFLPKLVVGGEVGAFAVVSVYAITFSPSDISAMIVAVAALVAAIGTVIVNIMTARRVTAQMTEVATKVEEVKTKTETIGVHVNSAATASVEKINALERAMTEMHRLLAEANQREALASQATAMTGVMGTTKDAPKQPAIKQTPAVVSTLKDIEENTAETAANTAKTDAAIEELKEKP